jgi:N-acetylneuraminic acid mutarotase
MQSCTKNASADLIGNWVRVSPFGGYARSEAITFTMGNVAYVGLGSSATDRFASCYRYDLTNDYWTVIDTFPGAPRTAAVAFAIGTKGYVCTGFDGVNYLNDTWQYDSTSNQWHQMLGATFPGTPRYDAFSFAINNIGYVGGGYDGNYLNDFYAFNPADSSWTQKPSLRGDKRSAAQTFVLNNMGYVCSGNNNGSALNDLVAYDPSSDTWTPKRKLTNVSDSSFDDNYTSIIRYNGVGFVMNNKAYITTGENGSLNAHTWEYDYTTDLWTEKTAFSGTARTGAVAFTVNNRGFVLTGRSGTSPFDNMYEWQPNVPNNTLDD